MRIIKKYSALILIFFVLFIIYEYESFKYRECIKVGHSKTYCILNIGEK